MAYDEMEEKVPYIPISPEEAREKIEAGTRVIDVRRPAEWERGHIAEAELIPVEAGIYAFGTALKDLNLALDEEVIFVCAAGQRSAVACEIARLTGLNKVYNLENGMNGWIYRGFPIER